MPATAVTGLLNRETLHARIDEIKRAKGAPPWSEKIVVNDQVERPATGQTTERRSS